MLSLFVVMTTWGSSHAGARTGQEFISVFEAPLRMSPDVLRRATLDNRGHITTRHPLENGMRAARRAVLIGVSRALICDTQP